MYNNILDDFEKVTNKFEIELIKDSETPKNSEMNLKITIIFIKGLAEK